MDTVNDDLLAAPPASADWRRMLVIGWTMVVFTLVVLGGWSATARLDAAVVAQGVISVETNRKTVQHLEGGIVSEIFVRDGQVVREGDILLRLDPTRNVTNERAYRQQRAIALALEARLLAQRDGAETVVFPSEVLAGAEDPVIRVAIEDNKRQFESRRKLLAQSLDIVDQQIAQIRSTTEQARVQRKTAAEQVALLSAELESLEPLVAKGLVTQPRIKALERERANQQGNLDSAVIAITKSDEQIAEQQSRIGQLRQDYQQEAADQLNGVRLSLSQVEQSLALSVDQLARAEVRAPVAGTVQQLRFFTVGGVIRPGEPILDIVPNADRFVVRARVAPGDRDRVHADQTVEVRLPQFSLFLHSPIAGTVATVSQDSILDEASRQSYFATEVSVDRASIPQDIAGKLTAGMIVDVIIPTEERTVLAYLLGPMLGHLATSMRER
ncbi:MAG: HlyD family type I secretion periplasmic adaptor subunit [Labrys sp. (in: a-proteobacteria)]